MWFILLMGLVSGDPTPAVLVKFPTPVAVEHPEPIVDSSVPFLLLPGRLYVVQSDKPFFLRAYPAGLVTVKSLSGPRDFYGVFADGSGKDEDRSYSAKYLAVVKSTGTKTGRITLVGITAAELEEDAITEVLIDIGVAPRPPPDDVKPDKPDEPKPVEPETDTLKSLLKATTAKYATLPAVDRPKLAAAFRDAAKKIESGEITTMQQLTKVTADLMVEQVGLNALLPWIAWRDDVTVVLKTQNLSTPKDNLAAWKLIADVLENK